MTDRYAHLVTESGEGVVLNRRADRVVACGLTGRHAARIADALNRAEKAELRAAEPSDD